MGGGGITSATDGNGFDFTVSSGALSANTTVGNNQLFYSNSGALTGDANITRTGSGALSIGTSVNSPYFFNGNGSLEMNDGNGWSNLRYQGGATTVQHGQVTFETVYNERLRITSSEVLFNNPGTAYNFRVKTDSRDSVFYIDGPGNKIRTITGTDYGGYDFQVGGTTYLHGTLSTNGSIIPVLDNATSAGDATHRFSQVWTGQLQNTSTIDFSAGAGSTFKMSSDGSFQVNTKFSVLQSGKITSDATMTAGGTTGAQTINKPSGSVNIAAAGTSVVVTNSLATTASIILCQIMTNDATATSTQVVAASGSFTIYLNAAATAETKIAFFVIN